MLALNDAQIPQHLAGPEELDLDSRVDVGFEMLRDRRRDGRRVQERRAAVPFDLGPLPLVLGDVLVLDDPADLTAVKEAEGRAERRGRPSQHEDLAPIHRLANFLFCHGLMLNPFSGLVKAAQNFRTQLIMYT